MKFLRNRIISLISSIAILIALTVFIYYKLPQTFFQQDEWYGFGQALYMRKIGFTRLFEVLGTYHLTPLSTFIYFVQFYIFELRSNYYAYISILLHLIVGLFIYRIMLKISKNIIIATISSIFFLLSNSLSQGVTWFAANIAVEFTAIFSLLSLNFFINYFQGKQTLGLYLSFIFLYLGLLCKEDIFVLAIIYVVFFFFVENNYKKTSFYIVGIFPYVIFRIYSQYRAYLINSSAISTANILNKSILLKNFSILLSGIGEAILSPYVLRSKFELLLVTFIKYGVLNDDLIIKKLIPIIGFILTLLLFCFSVAIYLKNRGKKDFKYLPLFLTGSVLSFLPYVFLGREVVWLESRYFYLPMIWISLLIGFLLLSCTKLQKIICFIILFVLIYENAVFTKASIVNYLPLSKTRRRTVENIRKSLTNSDNIVYYIQNGEDLPFQSGKGQTLLVLQTMQNQNLAPLSNDFFLWDIGTEGYKKIGNEGFGYFYDKEKLQKAVQEYKFDMPQIISLNYDKVNNTFKYISYKQQELTQ